MRIVKTLIICKSKDLLEEIKEDYKKVPIYEVRNKRFISKYGKEAELTNREHKLLICLSSGNTIRYENINEYLCGYDDKAAMPALRKIKCNLIHKTGLNIKTLPGIGYRLETEVFYK